MQLLSIFNQFKPSKVMFVGDFMLDVYTIGSVKRISPEAPVSILKVEREERLPGGAGNAIRNAIALGLEVVAVGRVGDDSAGHFLLDSLAHENVDIRGIFIDPEYQTPLKNRLIAENQQIVRVDYEQSNTLNKKLERHILDFLPMLLEGVQIVAFSDYAKGFVTPNLFSEIQQITQEKGIRIIVDPKGKDFTKYRGAFLIKPNLSEAIHAAGAEIGTPLEEVASTILSLTNSEALLITRSKDGMSLFSKEQPQKDFPVPIREVKDVTGAGDTVLATLTAALASQVELEKAIQLANIAAGIAVERVGCAQVTLSELLHRLLEIDVANKIFGEDHLFVLQQVLKSCPMTILALSGAQGLTTAVFKTIRTLAEKNNALVLYMLDQADEEFLHLLASLKEVRFIILKTESLHHLDEHIHPQELYLIDEKQLHVFDRTHQLLEYCSRI